MVDAALPPNPKVVTVHTRRFRAITSVGLTALLALGACGGSTEDKGDTSASKALDQTSVSGGSEKKAPTVTLKPTPLTVTETTTKVVKEGSGDPVAKNAIVSVKFVMLNGKDGSKLNDNYSQATAGLALD